MTRQQRKELRESLDSMAGDIGLALDVAWKSTKGKTESEAMTTITDLVYGVEEKIRQFKDLIDEIEDAKESSETAVV